MARKSKGKSGGARGKRSTGVDGKKADEGDAPQEMTNIEHRAEYIRAQKQQIGGLASELEKLQTETSGKRKLVNDAFRAMKSKLGMKREDIVFAFRALDLEEGVRDETLDTIREIFNASGVGFQGDMVEVLERQQAKAEAKKRADGDWGENDTGDVRPDHLKERERQREEPAPAVN